MSRLACANGKLVCASGKLACARKPNALIGVIPFVTTVRGVITASNGSGTSPSTLTVDATTTQWGDPGSSTEQQRGKNTAWNQNVFGTSTLRGLQAVASSPDPSPTGILCDSPTSPSFLGSFSGSQAIQSPASSIAAATHAIIAGSNASDFFVLIDRDAFTGAITSYRVIIPSPVLIGIRVRESDGF